MCLPKHNVSLINQTKAADLFHSKTLTSHDKYVDINQVLFFKVASQSTSAHT